MRNGERGTRNEERTTGNGKRETRNGERETENEERETEMRNEERGNGSLGPKLQLNPLMTMGSKGSEHQI